MRKFNKLFTIFTMCYCMIFQHYLYAIEVIVKLPEGRNLRRYAQTESGTKFLSMADGKYIKKGTELRIPLEELTDKNGIDRYKTMSKDERQKAVVKWLSNPKWSSLETFDFRASGRPKRDFFLKVKTQDGEEGFMQLASLGFSKNLDLVTIQDDILLDEEVLHGADDKDIVNDVDLDENKVSSAQVCSSPLPSQMFPHIDDKAIDISKAIEEEMIKKAIEGAKRTTPKDTVRLFNSSSSGCKKYSEHIDNEYCKIMNISQSSCKNKTSSIELFDKYNKIIKVKSKKKSIPHDLMLALMSQESSGRCEVSATDSGHSSGLFQINVMESLSTEFLAPHCPAILSCHGKRSCEKVVIETQCLDKVKKSVFNPITNLDLALDLISEKFRSLNNQAPSEFSDSFNTLSKSEQDRWRKTMSGYNGGGAHVKNAKSQIDDFNKEFGTDLDPEDWQTRRAFLLKNLMSAQYEYQEKENRNIVQDCDKHFLKAGYRQSYIGQKEFKDKLKSSKAFGVAGYKDWRHVCFSRSNVTFVDTMLGSGLKHSPPSRIDEWNKYYNP